MQIFAQKFAQINLFLNVYVLVRC